MPIPLELEKYVAGLLAVVGKRCESLWLFGSRANGRGRPDSDWDLVLFADPEVLEVLRATPSFQQDNIDLLVAVSPERWISPWPDGDKGPKGGSAEMYVWKEAAPGRATYRGEPVYAPKQWWKEPDPVQEELCAYQIWPEPAA